MEKRKGAPEVPEKGRGNGQGGWDGLNVGEG